MIPYIVPLIQNIGIEIQRAKNMHKFRSIIYFIIAFANLGISIPLGKYYGAVGTTFGTTLSTIIGNIILMNWYYHKKVGLNIIEFIKSMIQPSISVILAVIIGVSVRRVFPVDSWAAFLSQAGLFLGIYAILLYLIGLNNDEKTIVKQMFRQKNI